MCYRYTGRINPHAAYIMVRAYTGACFDYWLVDHHAHVEAYYIPF